MRGGCLFLISYCCYDENSDERMMMNGCNVALERSKLREPSLGFLN